MFASIEALSCLISDRMVSAHSPPNVDHSHSLLKNQSNPGNVPKAVGPYRSELYGKPCDPEKVYSTVVRGETGHPSFSIILRKVASLSAARSKASAKAASLATNSVWHNPIKLALAVKFLANSGWYGFRKSA